MRKFSLLVLALSLAACRDSGGGDDVVTPDSGNGGAQTIYDVQNDAMTAGTKVSLKGVIVTAIDNYGGKKGDFWVQEADGGEYSGVHVYGGPVDQVGALALGDIVDISGAQKAEFALTSDTSGNTLTELEPVDGGTMAITKTGSGPQVQPKVIDALAIGQLTDFMARHAEWEKWEGVLVTVSNVAAFGDDDYVSSKCPGTMCPDDTLYKFDITGDIVVESALAANPAPKVLRGDCLGSVTGVVDYFFDYLIYPRTTAEISTGGTSCPTENQSAVCGDGIDNDGNGFKDCGDNACIPAVSSCRTLTTINAIQTAATAPTGGIELQDVYVAAISKNKKNMWVQSSLTAAPNEGVYVFGPGNNLDGFAIGSRVDIIGTVTEFNDSTGTDTLTEVKALSVTAGTAGVGAVVPVTGTAASAMSETYEGVLVRLTNVKVTTVGTTTTGGTFGVGAATQYPAATVFKTDDDIFLLNTANACYATIDGIWTYLPYNDAYGFLPLAAGVTTGGNCN